ncbi:MAG: hypothetical protein P4K80_02310, partial [Acidobacteriaceae bacterium]|nr:hypothetical protein [Acidobacteriaceae bacterium]
HRAVCIHPTQRDVAAMDKAPGTSTKTKARNNLSGLMVDDEWCIAGHRSLRMIWGEMAWLGRRVALRRGKILIDE